jgi:hypothetical protein
MTRGYLSPRSTATAYKRQIACEVAREISQPKSALIRELAKLERVGNTRAADSLGRIIARLESWQARNG